MSNDAIPTSWQARCLPATYTAEAGSSPDLDRREAAAHARPRLQRRDPRGHARAHARGHGPAVDQVLHATRLRGASRPRRVSTPRSRTRGGGRSGHPGRAGRDAAPPPDGGPPRRGARGSWRRRPDSAASRPTGSRSRRGGPPDGDGPPWAGDSGSDLESARGARFAPGPASQRFPRPGVWRRELEADAGCMSATNGRRPGTRKELP